MKILSLLSKKAGIALLVACSSFIILMASCSKKNDPIPDPVGEARVRYANTVQGSLSQDFYNNSTKKNSAAVSYGNFSDYFVFTSGFNSFKVTDLGSTTANAESQQVQVQIGAYITALYYKKPDGSVAIGLIGDDMTAPASGKAKIRFVNLNNFLGANASVSIFVGSSALIPSLTYGGVSDYFSVDAGTKFTFASTGVTNAPIFDAGVVAGKNYTVWIDGTDAATLTGHAMLQN